jgi:hypothetical protein
VQGLARTDRVQGHRRSGVSGRLPVRVRIDAFLLIELNKPLRFNRVDAVRDHKTVEDHSHEQEPQLRFARTS